MGVLHILAAVALVQAATQPAPVDTAEPVQDAPADVVQADAPETPADAILADTPVAPAEPSKVDAQGIPTPPQPTTDGVAYYPTQTIVQSASGDRRVQLLPYNPDQIVTLGVSPGFASVVELADDERVENVVVGNSGAWQVTANRRGDRVIVKPLAGAAPSNMIVLTGSRRYLFVLDPYGETSFVMRFSYPQPVQTAAALTQATTYTFRGDKALFPLAMSDDSRRTTIRWSEQSVLPAVFAMSGRRSEELVNGRMVGNNYVIEGAAPRYKFRYGKAEATATRQMSKRRR